MASFGERLRRERELRGITLENIAESTKIGKRNLQALENEEFNKLPGGIFNKGFVRAYAKYLGIDEEQAVTEFLEAESAAATGKRSAFVEAVSPEAKTTPEAAHGARLNAKKIHRSKDNSRREQPAVRPEVEINPPLNPDPTANRIWVVVAIAALAITYLGWRHFSHRPSDAATNPQPVQITAPTQPKPELVPPQTTAATAPVQQDDAAKAAPLPSPAVTNTVRESSKKTTETVTAPAPESKEDLSPKAKPRTANDKIGIHVRATDDSWIQVSADGRLLMDGVLRPADEREFRADRELVFKTGNAGGVELARNGKAIGAIGRLKQVRTLTFTPDGVQRQ